ncbi:MAG: hypothetical protein FJ291_07365 [Planctomycetes bacterium]|nr:hypothetical protein [Planctomycetota bacterium]
MEAGRYIGVVGDGGTDREILGCVVQHVLQEGGAEGQPLMVVHLRRQNMRDYLDKYWRLVAQSGTAIAGEPSRTLQRGVIATLYGAWEELKSHAKREITRRDMLVLSSDAERYLSRAEEYFEDWAWMLGATVILAAERFRHALSRRGYSLDYVPVVVPVVPFPSTDVLIAVARNSLTGGIRARGADPRKLKKALYGTEDLRSLSQEDFRKHALTHIDAKAIAAMYSEVPEIRSLLQWLSWAASSM